jgi:hypothetical protein
MDGDDQHHDEVGFLATTKALADVQPRLPPISNHTDRDTSSEERKRNRRRPSSVNVVQKARGCRPGLYALEYHVITEIDDVTELEAARSHRSRVFKLDVRICGCGGEQNNPSIGPHWIISRVFITIHRGYEVAVVSLKAGSTIP